MCEQRQQFSSVSSANSVSSASSKSVNRASNTQQQQRFATCSPVSRRNHHCHDHLQISLERIFRRSSLIRFLRFTGQLQLCGCIVQYLSQCSSVVFFPDPVADVCRFKGLGLRAQQRQVCLCQSYAFASFAHSPSVLLLVVVVCTVTDVLGRDPSSAVCSTSSCYYGFVAVLRVSMHIVGICAHASIVGTRRRYEMRTSAQGLASTTSGVLVQVCHGLWSSTVSCHCCIPVVFCVRPPVSDPTDSEWKRSAAQRQVIG